VRGRFHESERVIYRVEVPSAYQIFKVDSGLDIMKNTSVPVKDKVKEFTYKVSGGNLGSLFDGSEKVLSIDAIHWSTRAAFAP